MMEPELRIFGEPGDDPQLLARVAVIIPTLLRPSLDRALASVFAQDLGASIQVLIGVDQPEGDPERVARLCRDRPPNCRVLLFYPGYSTARRHGGIQPPGDGGALRQILTHLAHSRHVAYLDDDNWWEPNHLSSLFRAKGRAAWAFSLRHLVHPETGGDICVDTWESVGPGQGIFAGNWGGFADPNTLLVDQVACARALSWWNHPVRGDHAAMSADRNVFAALARDHAGIGSGLATVHYTLNPDDPLHPVRLARMGAAWEAAGRNGP